MLRMGSIKRLTSFRALVLSVVDVDSAVERRDVRIEQKCRPVFSQLISHPFGLLSPPSPV